MGIVFIKALKINTTIGVYAWERRIKQSVLFDIEMNWDIKKASKTDDIQYTLDYKKVVERVQAFVEASAFQLVESLAEEVAALIMKEFSVSKLTVKLSKPNALDNVESVGVIIERDLLQISFEAKE